MKPLTCEMCGSTNLVKKDGNFECQSCGTKYSVEEAKKMMIDGSVEIKGSVKINRQEELNNYLELSSQSLEDNHVIEAYSYAIRALEIDPNNIDALMSKVNALILLGTIEDPRFDELSNTGNKIIELTQEENIKGDVYNSYIMKSYNALGFYINVLQDTEYIKSIYDLNKISNPSKADEITSSADADCQAVMAGVDSILNLLENIPKNIIEKNENLHTTALAFALQYRNYVISLNERAHVYNMYLLDDSIDQHNKILNNFKSPLPDSLKEKIKPIPYSEKKSGGGCYIATAYYGTYDCPEVWILRRYRDNTLHKSWIGRQFITLYYAISPTVVKWFGQSKIFKKICKYPLEHLVTTLYKKGVNDTPYQDQNF